MPIQMTDKFPKDSCRLCGQLLLEHQKLSLIQTGAARLERFPEPLSEQLVMDEWGVAVIHTKCLNEELQMDVRSLEDEKGEMR